VKTILLVDDDAAMRQMLARMLAPLSCRFLEAVDGLSAVALATQERPDLILLDLVMPALDGWGVLRALQGEPATAAIKVLLVTGSGEVELSMVQAAGAIGLLEKPFTLAQLRAQVEPLLASKEAR
jgi:CheY-like chemotaxis protein